MKTVRSDVYRCVLGLVLGCIAGTAAAELDLRLAVSSTYLNRGLEYSLSSPAYQAALEYRRGGWFAGAWASTVDFGSYDDRSVEIDYYLGYGHRFSPEVALEATVIRYTFQGSSPRESDWSELQLSAYLGQRWTVTWGVAENWWATDERSELLETTFRHPLPGRLTLDATAGYQFADRAAGVSYGYAEAGLARRLGDVVVRVGYAAVESQAQRRFYRFAGDRWLASLTWQP